MLPLMAPKGHKVGSVRHMGRPLSGRLELQVLSDGRTAYVARFSANGRRRKVTLGHDRPFAGEAPMSEAEARAELDYIVQQVKRNEWVSAADVPTPAAPGTEPTIALLADEFFRSREDKGVGVHGMRQQRELLEIHVLPYWSGKRPSDVTIREVEAWRKRKLAERGRLDALRDKGQTRDTAGRPLPRGAGPRRLNRAMDSLYAVLDFAAPRYGTRDSKALRDQDLHVTVPEVKTYHVTCAQMQCLIDAAAQLDKTARDDRQAIGRKAIIATLGLAGLRLGELCALNIEDCDFERRVLEIRDAKTSAGRRAVNMTMALDPILREHVRLNRVGAMGKEPLFATSRGSRQDPGNVRPRIFYRALEVAKALAAERGVRAFADHITPHSMRRTYITHLLELPEPLRYVQAQAGHMDAKLTMEVYAKVDEYRGPRDPLLDALYRTDVTSAVASQG